MPGDGEQGGPTAITKLLAQHIDDGLGHCRACGIGDQRGHFVLGACHGALCAPARDLRAAGGEQMPVQRANLCAPGNTSRRPRSGWSVTGSRPRKERPRCCTTVVTVSIRLGYQIPHYSYGTGVAELFPTVVAQAREAEDAGFDAVFVMDHFYSGHGMGAPDQPMLECYATLAALAASTSRVQLASLVAGNTFRNPALLAKTVSTLDVISQGRAALGIGAGWYELEHRQLGFEFGTVAERCSRLDEALAIIAPMLRGERPSLDGTWYRAETATNEPRLRDDLPIILGGAGERKTFALAARHAQHLNILCAPAELPRKLAALDERCAEAGRDRASLETSFYTPVIIDEDGDRARRMLRDFLRGMGVDLDALDDEQRAAATEQLFVGTPDDVAADLRERVLDRGVDGLVLNPLANGHEPGAVALAGRTVGTLLGR